MDTGTHATHAVVDERDGMTWVKDGDGQLMDQARAEALAGKWNDACKTEHQTYAVYRLELVRPAPALSPCAECGGGCPLDPADRYVGSYLPHRSTCSQAEAAEAQR
jgi:hypothetical protein